MLADGSGLDGRFLLFGGFGFGGRLFGLFGRAARKLGNRAALLGGEVPLERLAASVGPDGGDDRPPPGAGELQRHGAAQVLGDLAGLLAQPHDGVGVHLLGDLDPGDGGFLELLEELLALRPAVVGLQLVVVGLEQQLGALLLLLGIEVLAEGQQRLDGRADLLGGLGELLGLSGEEITQLKEEKVVSDGPIIE